VPAAQIAALAGWVVDYGKDAGEPRSTRVSAWRWDEAPVPPPFLARVRGTLRIAHDGPHRLIVDSDADATLSVDGERLLHGTGRRHTALTIARGNHAVALDVRVRRPGAATALRWVAPGEEAEGPVPANRMYSPLLPRGGLLGSYHRDPDWGGEPALLQIDTQVAFYFHVLPLPRPFSVRWSGSVYAPVAGSYAFATASVDGSSVVVAGRPVVENRLVNASVEGHIQLEKGWHPIEVRYQAQRDYSQVFLYWTPPGGTRELVPQEALRPPGPGGALVAASEPAAALALTAPPAAGALTLVRSRELRTEGALRLAGGPDGRLVALSPGRIESFAADHRHDN
jgi:hypothetical protein